MEILLRKTCLEIVDFAQLAMMDQRWMPGSNETDINRYERVQHIAWMANILLNEGAAAERAQRDPTVMGAAATSLVVEIAEHARAAMKNRTLRATSLDCYPVMTPFEADAENRRIDAKLAAAVTDAAAAVSYPDDVMLAA